MSREQGRKLVAQNKKVEAVQLNNAILKEHPGDPDATTLESEFLVEKGDIQQAIANLQRLLQRTPNSYFARYNLGRAQLSAGNRDHSLRCMALQCGPFGLARRRQRAAGPDDPAAERQTQEQRSGKQPMPPRFRACLSF